MVMNKLKSLTMNALFLACSLFAAPILCLTPANAAVGEMDREAPETHVAPTWDKVNFIEQNLATLHARAAKLPSLSKSPVPLAAAAISPDILGYITTVTTTYDSMEEPSKVVVTITDGGIMDDDLISVRHIITLTRNDENGWKASKYTRGELRRQFPLDCLNVRSELDTASVSKSIIKPN